MPFANVDLVRRAAIQIAIFAVALFPVNGFTQILGSSPPEQNQQCRPPKMSLADLSMAITAHRVVVSKEKPDSDEIKRQTEKIETILTEIGLPAATSAVPGWADPAPNCGDVDERIMQGSVEALTYLGKYYTASKDSPKAEERLKHALALGFLTKPSPRTSEVLDNAFGALFAFYLAQQDTDHPDLDKFLSKLFEATETEFGRMGRTVRLVHAREWLSQNKSSLYNLLPRFDSRTISEAHCFEPRKDPPKLRAVLVGDTLDRTIGAAVALNLNLLTAALSQRGVSGVVVDDRPSRERMLGDLREVAAKSECGDAVFLYYTGHGLGPEQTDSLRALALPQGYDRGLFLGREAAFGSFGAIWSAELAEFVTAIRNRGANVFLFLDTMGIADIGRLQAGALVAALDDYRLPGRGVDNVAFRELTPTVRGGGAFAVFYAARPGTYSWFLMNKGGFFTVALAKVLAGEAKPTVSQIADAISKECSATMSVGGKEIPSCTPVFESSDPNMVFLEPRKPLGSTDLRLEISSPPTADRYPSGAYRIANQKFVLAGSVLDANQFGRLIVDHRPADMDPSGNFTVSIELVPGQEKVVVDAIGRDFTVRSQTFEFSYAGDLNRAVAAGQRYALVIGIQNYDHKDSWGDLKTPLNDAKEVAQVLHDLYGFQTEIEVQGKKRSLLLLDASKKDIDDAFTDIRKMLANNDLKNDSLLIYYAGHGTRLRDVDRAYWIPREGDLDDQHTWISAADLVDDLKRINARSILVVSDSCFSGAMTRSIPDLSAFSQDKKQALLRAGSKRSRLFMSSGGDEPVLDKGKGCKDAHSVFACAFINGLRRFPEPIFGARDFHQMEIMPIGGSNQQMPEMKEIANSGDEGGEFIFARVEAQEAGKKLEAQDSAK